MRPSSQAVRVSFGKKFQNMWLLRGILTAFVNAAYTSRHVRNEYDFSFEHLNDLKKHRPQTPVALFVEG